MGGSSLASFGNLFGGSTFGSNNTSPAGTTPGSNIGGRFTEFNPATMGDTFEAPKVAPPPAVAAGMSASGLPAWQTNWLQSGGKGDLTAPVSAVGGATNNNTAAVKAVNPAQPTYHQPGVGSYRGVQTGGGTTTTPTTQPGTQSTYMAPRQGAAPAVNLGSSGVTMQMLDKVSDAGIQQMLARNWNSPDLAYAGPIRGLAQTWTKGVPEDFFKYAQWRLGTAGMAGPQYSLASDPRNADPRFATSDASWKGGSNASGESYAGSGTGGLY